MSEVSGAEFVFGALCSKMEKKTCRRARQMLARYCCARALWWLVTHKCLMGELSLCGCGADYGLDKSLQRIWTGADPGDESILWRQQSEAAARFEQGACGTAAVLGTVLTSGVRLGRCSQVPRAARAPAEAGCDSGKRNKIPGAERSPPAPPWYRWGARPRPRSQARIRLTDLQRRPHRLPLPLLGLPDRGRHLRGGRGEAGGPGLGV